MAVSALIDCKHCSFTPFILCGVYLYLVVDRLKA
eukprot:COSAG06_NODE_17077_length_962_cov_0.997683_2_plen_33_part_01